MSLTILFISPEYTCMLIVIIFPTKYYTLTFFGLCVNLLFAGASYDSFISLSTLSVMQQIYFLLKIEYFL